ncbi:hypothetical protein [Candidatus Dormiibacter inghamiae]|uniref:hypothetical protein n=1 Tax=Candidatus Dormiibacter inghamiae TaxID=3127013 RepID=UPI0030C6F420
MPTPTLVLPAVVWLEARRLLAAGAARRPEAAPVAQAAVPVRASNLLGGMELGTSQAAAAVGAAGSVVGAVVAAPRTGRRLAVVAAPVTSAPPPSG